MSEINYIKIDHFYWSVDLENGKILPCSRPGKKETVVDLTVQIDVEEKVKEAKESRLKFFQKRWKVRQIRQEAATYRVNFNTLFESKGLLVGQKLSCEETKGQRQQAVADQIAQLADHYFRNVVSCLRGSHSLSTKRAVLFFAKRLFSQESGFAQNVANATGKNSDAYLAEKLQEAAREMEQQQTFIKVGKGYYIYDGESISSCYPWNERLFFAEDQVDLVDLSSGTKDKAHISALQVLFERKKGTHLYATVKESQFELHTVKTAKEGRLYRKHKKLQLSALKQVTTQAFQALGTALQTLQLKGQQQQAVEKLLRSKVLGEGPVARLASKVFDRGLCVPTCGPLERYLNTDIREKREAFSKALEGLNKDFSEDAASFKRAKITLREAYQDYMVAELKLAISLGIGLRKISSSGTGGARYGFDRFGQKVGIVKPDDEGPYGENNPAISAWFKRTFVAQRACLYGNRECLQERGAAFVDAELDLWLVPPTSSEMISSQCFVKMPYKLCSVQAFAEDAIPLEKLAKVPLFRNSAHWYMKQKQKVEKKIQLDQLGNDHIFTLPERAELAKLTMLHGKYAVDPTTKKLILPQDQLRTKEDYLKACASFAQKIQMAGIEDAAITNTDGHKGNFLIATKQVDDPSVKALFSQNGTIEMEELKRISDHLFDPGSDQRRLYTQVMHALFSGDEGETIVVKIDAGGALAHSHPTTRFQMRNSFGFADLPFMDQPFSDESKQFVDRADQSVGEAILMLACQNFLNFCTKEEFEFFWRVSDNRNLFKKWALLGKEEDKNTLLRTLLAVYKEPLEEANRLVTQLKDMSKKTPEQWVEYREAKKHAETLKRQKLIRERTLRRNKERVGGMIQTFKERWKLLLCHTTTFEVDPSPALPKTQMKAQTYLSNATMRNFFSIKLRGQIANIQRAEKLIPELNARMELFNLTMELISHQPVEQQSRLPETFDYSMMQRLSPLLLEDLITSGKAEFYV